MYQAGGREDDKVNAFILLVITLGICFVLLLWQGIYEEGPEGYPSSLTVAGWTDDAYFREGDEILLPDTEEKVRIVAFEKYLQKELFGATGIPPHLLGDMN